MNKIMKKSAILFLTFITFIFVIISFCSVIKIVYANNSNIIYIDPGHGGFDGGALSKNKEVIEKDLVLEISLKLAYYLKQMGYKVALTRDKDTALAHTKKEDIYKRVELINSNNTLLYVSIHANSYPNKSVKGAQCFYDNSLEENKLLASYISEMLKAINPYNNRKEKIITGKYLINNSEKVGCLIEVGFLSNAEELALLKTKSYQEKLAYGIFLGILKYLGHNGDTMSKNNKNNLQVNSVKLAIPTPTDMERLGWLIESICYPKIVFAMNGNLGAGKTTLTKGLGKALGIKRTINSPTFTIMKVYEGKMPLYHLDVYRIENSNDDFELEEYFDLDGISVIEWADNIRDLLPPNTIYLTFTILEDGTREVEFVSCDTKFINELKNIAGEYIC